MAARMTAEMWKIGARNALIAGLTILVLLWGGTLVVSLLSDQSFMHTLGVVFDLFWIAVFTNFFISWLWGRSVYGTLVLDCGPGPSRALYIFNAAMFVVTGLIFLEQSSGAPLGYRFSFSAALLYTIAGLSRVQIRENGIWQGATLMKWEKILAFEWNGQVQGAIKVQLRSKFSFTGRGVLLIPDEHKEACCRALEAHGVARV
ncbi:MAG: hypothetical protein JNK74_15985 [Candidatus Hydrogenedentes bacterium]|nr:hypothetical protein [Candidatus Hydrogenedentota bacterium]